MVLGNWYYDSYHDTWSDHSPYTMSGINAFGQFSGNLADDPYFYTGSEWIAIPELPGLPNSAVTDIRTFDSIGYAFTAPPEGSGLADSATEFIDYYGMLIGYSYDSDSSAGYGFAWDSDSGTLSLNDPALVSGLPTGYRIERPTDINRFGWISGTAATPSGDRAFLLAQPFVPGDVNGDGWVSGIDLTIVITNWGLSDAIRLQGDLNGDGTVSGADYTEVITYWGGTGTPPPRANHHPRTRHAEFAAHRWLGTSKETLLISQGLQIQLEHCYRMTQLESFQHLRVHFPDLTDTNPLAAIFCQQQLRSSPGGK